MRDPALDARALLQVGEAANPGPPRVLTVGSINVTSMGTAGALVKATGWGAAMIQEVWVPLE